MQAFLLKLLVAAIKNEDIRAFLLEVVDRLGNLLLPKLSAVIPVAVGVAMKRLADAVDGLHLPDAKEVVEDIRSGVNALLPEDIDIPILSDAFEKVTGFDLSDVLLGHHK